MIDQLVNHCVAYCFAIVCLILNAVRKVSSQKDPEGDEGEGAMREVLLLSTESEASSS